MAKSLAHTKWMCKYHIVFTPKYRRKIVYNQYKESIIKILKDLCKWKGAEIIDNGRSYTSVGLNTTEIQYLEHHGISEGEKCIDDL